MFGDTSVGKIRKSNQDSIFYSEDAKAGIVADGIGGRRGGEIASSIVVQEFAKFLQKKSGKLSAAQTPELYAALMEDINYKVFAFGERHKNMSGLGTTATAVQFIDKQLFIPHCGDSRTYMFANDHLFRLTIDHNIASSIRHGWLDPRTVPQRIKRNVLTRGVGLAKQIDVDIYQLPIAAKQIFLTCSDGLSDMVDDRRILRIIKHNKNYPQHIPKLLIDEACAHGGRDNITVLISKVVSV